MISSILVEEILKDAKLTARNHFTTTQHLHIIDQNAHLLHRATDRAHAGVRLENDVLGIVDGERNISSGAEGDAEGTISTGDVEEEKNGTLTRGRCGRKSEPEAKMSGM